MHIVHVAGQSPCRGGKSARSAGLRRPAMHACWTLARMVPTQACLRCGSRRQLSGYHLPWQPADPRCHPSTSTSGCSSRWTPPEAAQAAVQHVQSAHSWPCPRCTLVNAPAAAACEVCSARRPAHSSQPQLPGPQGPPGFPALPGSSAGPAEAPPPAGESQPAPSAAPAHGKGRKQGNFERLRLGGDPQVTPFCLLMLLLARGPEQALHCACPL